MPVRFLLDEHISPFVADAAVRRGLDVEAVAGSDLMGSDDATVLRAAIDAGRILVTYDTADFAPLVSDAVMAGVDVPGVVFVDGRTIPTSDVGGLARAIATLAGQIARGDVNAAPGVWLTRG